MLNATVNHRGTAKQTANKSDILHNIETSQELKTMRGNTAGNLHMPLT